jgi:hypothetical protein
MIPPITLCMFAQIHTCSTPKDGEGLVHFPRRPIRDRFCFKLSNGFFTICRLNDAFKY